MRGLRPIARAHLQGYRFIRTGYDQLAVSEMFRSYQGEGPSAGAPAIFLRLQGCNLFCVWCDTIDTWVKGSVYSVDDIIDLWISSGWAEDLYRGHMLVITGGEPLLRQGQLVLLIRRIVERLGLRPRVEVETNGTIKPIEKLVELVDQFNVSPKLRNSGMLPKTRFRLEALRALAKSGKAIFKFVIVNKEDISEVLHYIETVPLPRDKVYLMPESRSREEYLERLELVKSLCREHGLRLSPRLHLLYGWR